MKPRCELWDGIRLTVSSTSQNSDISASKCTITNHIDDEYLKQWTFEEFDKIGDIKEELIKVTKSWSKNHHKEGEIFGCASPLDCWCPPEECELKHIEVSLSTECNLSCRFCGAFSFRKKVQDLGLVKTYKEHYFDILYKLKNLKLEYIRLTDYGEPLIYLSEIKKWLLQLTIDDTKEVRITTNGTLIDKEFIEIIQKKRKEGIEVVLTISLNSYNSKHYLQKMGKDFFVKVVSTILKLDSLGLPVLVSFLIDRKEEMKPIEEFIKKTFKSKSIGIMAYPENSQMELSQLPEFQNLMKYIWKRQ